MKYLSIITIFFYLLSTAVYITYFFVQKDFFQKLGYVFLLTGFIMHTIHITSICALTHTIPVKNLKETLAFTSWSIAGIYTVLRYKLNIKILGIFVSFCALTLLVLASILTYTPIIDHKLYTSLWLAFHIFTIFIGEASLALACITAILYLAQEKSIKTKKTGFFFKRLPSLNLLDITTYKCIMIGFSLLTLGLISGSVYANFVWGKFWSWDPKEVWSGITWIVYAIILHQRFTSRWQGRHTAILSIVGFAIVIFTFLGVNLFLSGHHDNFTK